MRAIIFCAVLFLTVSASGQTFKDVTYGSDNTNFPNPERGFYHHTEVRSSSYGLLSESTLRGYRNEGISLIIRVFYLEKFVDSPLSSAYLDNLRADFATARKAGVKIIVRFAYTSKSSAPFGDATPQRVLQHIKQLGPVLRENADVISVVQAGFIGAWGEWYYTDHFAKYVGAPTEEDWNNRRAVVNAMLAEFPADRSIQVRTPDIKRKLVQNTVAITSAEAFSNTGRGRIGHHNDCFLASANDYGTYINEADEKPYLEQETQFLPMGGETCGVSVPLSECPNALAQMQRFHWSYLNVDYHPDVIGGWAANMCIEDVQKKLGYRLKLTGANLQEASKPGGEVKFNLTLANEGWASPYNKRKVEIVLRNKTTNKEYRLITSDDPRKWLPSSNIAVNITGGLPANIEEGDYGVFLSLSSPELTLAKRPEYSIRLANSEVWEATTGYNDLHHTLTVSSSATAPTYSGTGFFLSTDVLPETLEAPSPLISSVFGTNTLLYWGFTNDDSYRIIERQADGGEFEVVATLPPGIFTYTDKALTAGTAYVYRSYLNNGTAVSPKSDEISVVAESTALPYYVHRTDGVIDEWVEVAPLQTLYADDETYSLKLFADKDSLYFHIGGQFSEYELKLDSWTSTGKTIKTKRVGENFEGAIPLSAITIGENNMISVSLKVDGHFLPAEGNTVNFIRTLPPPVLSGFTVSVLTQIQLAVQWQKCTTCLGITLERSTSPNEGFTEIAGLPGGAVIYYDNSVITKQTYYYRAVSFNEVGLSEYTAITSATPDVVTGIESLNEVVVAYPNPVVDVMTLKWRKGDRTLLMYDALGRAVYPELMNETPGERKYDVRSLSSGLYFVRINGDNGVTSISIKK